MGAIYVEVTADTTNGIMTMDASGGQEQGGYWIGWTSNGYIGSGWYWSYPNNYISTGWEISGLEATYGKGEAGFQNYINSDSFPGNLDLILGEWPSDSKLAFVLANAGSLGGCVTA